MRRQLLLLATLCFSSSALYAQSGFSSQVSYVNGNTALRSADFNRDGHPDLLLYGGSSSGSIAFNLGNGSFGTPTSLPISGPLQSVQIGDINGDGLLDIVACSANKLYELVNVSPGQFAVYGPVALANGCNSVNVGDVNGDGKLDIVVTGSTGGGAANRGATPNNSVQTFFGDGTGKFTAGPLTQNINLDSAKGTANISQCTLTDTVGGDFLGNGTYSIVVDAECFPHTQTSDNAYPADTNSTVFFANSDASGNFTFKQLTESSYYYHLQNTESNSSRADLNHDGRPDLLFSTSNGSIVTGLYNGGGTFVFLTPAVSYQGGNTVSPYVYGGIGAGDFNVDGVVDLATAFNGSLSASGSDGHGSTDQGNFLSVLYGQSSGNYAGDSPAAYGDGYSTDVPSVLVGDFNSDGRDDYAVISFNNLQNQYILTVYTNNQAPSTTCDSSSVPNTNIICQPTTTENASSPVTVTAASNLPGFTLNRLYLDNVAVYEVASQQINTNLPANAGGHTLVLVSYNNKGEAVTTSRTFNVSGPNRSGCLPSTSGVVICAPAQNSTSNSPVTFTAGATPPQGAGSISALRVYVDNTALFTVDNPDDVGTRSFQFTQSAAVAPGKHNLVVVGYESTGGAITASENFTVAGAAPCYPSSAGAMICSPANGATTSSPFTLTAGATAGSGYMTAIRVYSDNVAQTLINNPGKTTSFAVNPSITLAAGTHNLVIVGYQSTGGAVTASETVTIK